MRRQYPRNQMQYVGQNNAQYSNRNSIGYVMRERAADVKAEVEHSRRMLQMKYDQEAEDAEEKRKRKEKKKREEWLKRQEALFPPGYRLGEGKLHPNLRHDLVENQNIVKAEHENPNQPMMSEQYKLLVQQGMKRGMEAEELSGCFVGTVPSVQKQEGQTGYIRNAQEMAGHVLGSKNETNSTDVPSSSRNQGNDREKMLAARLRMQQQYTAELKKLEEPKNQTSS